MKFVILLAALLFPFGTGQVLANNPCCQPIEVVGKKPPTQVNDPGYMEPWDPEPIGAGGGASMSTAEKVAALLEGYEPPCKNSGETDQQWSNRAALSCSQYAANAMSRLAITLSGLASIALQSACSVKNNDYASGSYSGACKN